MNQMSEKRFKSTLDEDTMSIMPYLVSDNEEETFYNLQGCVDLLNEQQDNLDEIEKNFDDLVEWASKIAKRNVILDEQIGELQRENEQLRQQLKEKEEDERLYANEIVELRKTNEEWLQFKELGGDY